MYKIQMHANISNFTVLLITVTQVNFPRTLVCELESIAVFAGTKFHKNEKLPLQFHSNLTLQIWAIHGIKLQTKLICFTNI